MKRLALSIVLLFSGCAVGNLEVLNDVGKTGKTTGSIIRTIDSSCKVMTGHSCDKQKLNTPQINRTYGEIKQLPDYRGKSLPYILQEVRIFTR